jgi:2-hydroxyglutarate dehydrogenase
MSSERLETDVVVIGAGVIGLAVADKLATGHSVILVDAHHKFGQETSSRNSEVIHSGIHYPLNSKKTTWCIRGRDLLYDFCKSYSVPHAQTGKLVVATLKDEVAYLEKLAAHCTEIGVPFERWTGAAVSAKEPLVKVEEALYFPITGIVDSHAYMAALERFFIESGGISAYRHRVRYLRRDGQRWLVTAESPSGEIEIAASWVVNAAGLASAELSNRALNTRRYQHRFCRGRYFALSGKYQSRFNHLIYPVPPKDGLGIHVTIDMAGQARLGPDVDWCNEVEYDSVATLYNCDWGGIVNEFAAAARRYCPSIEPSHLAPALVGVRPKLFVDKKPFPDFVVESHQNFIHCLGIESPGLTASLAISDEVLRLVV